MGNSLTVKQLLDVLDGIAAFGLAAEWDNVGLMAGNPEGQVQSILVALDPTEGVLQEAKESGANCVITHHPLIFNPLKSIFTNQPIGRFLRSALENDIAVIGCHTNLDQAAGGVNDVLAEGIGLEQTRPLVDAGDPGQDGVGFGRVGTLAEPLSRQAFIEHLCSYFGLPVLRVAGSLPDKVTTVAVCGGSGSDLAEAAMAAGAQVYVTGEVKHSTARWAEAAGFCIVDAGHFATENPVVEALAEVLNKSLAEQGLGVKVRLSQQQQNPFAYLLPGQENA